MRSKPWERRCKPRSRPRVTAPLLAAWGRTTVDGRAARRRRAKCPPSCPSCRASWVRACGPEPATLLADNSFKSAVLHLRRPRGIVIPDQTAILDDDGKMKAQVQLQHVSGESVGSLLATVGYTTNGGVAVKIPGQLTLDPVAHVLTIAFPTFAKFGVTKQTDLGAAPKLNICKLIARPRSCARLSHLFRSACCSGPCRPEPAVRRHKWPFRRSPTHSVRLAERRLPPTRTAVPRSILMLGVVTDSALSISASGATLSSGTITAAGGYCPGAACADSRRDYPETGSVRSDLAEG